jgi:hypothetical protein
MCGAAAADALGHPEREAPAVDQHDDFGLGGERGSYGGGDSAFDAIVSEQAINEPEYGEPSNVGLARDPRLRHQGPADTSEFERRIALPQRAREIGAERVARGFRGNKEYSRAQVSPISARVKP